MNNTRTQNTSTQTQQYTKQYDKQIRMERFLFTCLASIAAFIALLALSGCGGSAAQDTQTGCADPQFVGPCRQEDSAVVFVNSLYADIDSRKQAQ